MHTRDWLSRISLHYIGMRFQLSIATAFATCFLYSAAWADQTNPALDALFVELKDAQTPVAAANTANTIWEIWTIHESDDDINRLMKDGLKAMQYGDLRLADKLFSDVISLDPNFAEGWNKRATIRFQLGLFEKSRADIAETLRLEERHFGALAGLGIVEIHLENPSAALRAYKAALALYPQMQNIVPIIEMLEEQVLGQPL